jgi:hypothetical protein
VKAKLGMPSGKHPTQFGLNEYRIKNFILMFSEVLSEHRAEDFIGHKISTC